jgi:hypothetical protein
MYPELFFGGTPERFLHRTKLIENPPDHGTASIGDLSQRIHVCAVGDDWVRSVHSLLFVDLDQTGTNSSRRHAARNCRRHDCESRGNQFECQSVIYVKHESDFAIPTSDDSSRSSSTGMQAFASSPAVRQCATELCKSSSRKTDTSYIFQFWATNLAVLQLNQKEDCLK